MILCAAKLFFLEKELRIGREIEPPLPDAVFADGAQGENLHTHGVHDIGHFFRR